MAAYTVEHAPQAWMFAFIMGRLASQPPRPLALVRSPFPPRAMRTLVTAAYFVLTFEL